VAGGILALRRGAELQISAAIGFISLFGVSSMDGILLVSYIRKNMAEGWSGMRRSSSPAKPGCGRFS
jgi:cobalt-zinc-cadmium resistance protein CzcA